MKRPSFLASKCIFETGPLIIEIVPSSLFLYIYIKREKSSRIYKSFHRPVFFSSPFFLPSRGRAARKTIKVGGRLERGVALSR